MAYQNGGGSFLIPYAIMLLFAGLPIFFLELSLGQYSRQGPLKAFGMMAPAFKGLGFAMIVCTAFVAIYYNMIMTWVIFYIISSFENTLPWTECVEGRNSPQCGYGSDFVTPPEDYFNYVMLGLDKDISWRNFGEMRWTLVGCMVAAWVIVCLSRGVRIPMYTKIKKISNVR